MELPLSGFSRNHVNISIYLYDELHAGPYLKWRDCFARFTD